MPGEAPAELRAFIGEIRGLLPGPPPAEPPFQPADGEPFAAWWHRVARAREEHDRHALAWRRATDAAARARFGTTAAELIGPGTTRPRQEQIVPVPAAPLAAELGGVFAQRVAAGETEREVRVQVITPSRPQGSAVVRLHGGAYWMGGGEVAETLDDVVLRRLAEQTGAVVIDVDYALAPEHPFPAAILDALAVLDAARSGALEPGIDPTRVAMIGTSSGANTAAVAAFADAERIGTTPLAGLGLIVPSADLTDLPEGRGAGPEAQAARERLVRGYLGPVPADRPEASPALRDRFAGAPPTFAAIARYDEVARGGAALVAGIGSAGVHTQEHVYDMTHTVAPPEVEAAVAADLIAFLRPRLSPPGR